jgi:hypothetical protein
MKKVPKKLGAYEEYDYIKTSLGKVAYDSFKITILKVLGCL